MKRWSVVAQVRSFRKIIVAQACDPKLLFLFNPSFDPR